jgi:hypothetical protein
MTEVFQCDITQKYTIAINHGLLRRIKFFHKLDSPSGTSNCLKLADTQLKLLNILRSIYECNFTVSFRHVLCNKYDLNAYKRKIYKLRRCYGTGVINTYRCVFAIRFVRLTWPIQYKRTCGVVKKSV